jgi:hypothetical protein
MWRLIAWSTPLPISECEQRLRNMPTRLWLVTRHGESEIVARMNGREFRLVVAGPAWRVFLDPYFHGFLIDAHGPTEIRGRFLPGLLPAVAVFGCLAAMLPLSLSAMAILRGAPSAFRHAVVSSGLVGACLALLVVGWRSSRAGGSRIATYIESRFDAHRLTGDSSRRRPASFPS